VPNSWSERLPVHRSDATWNPSGQDPTSDGRSSSSDHHRAYFGGTRRANVILNIKWRQREHLGRVLRLSISLLRGSHSAGRPEMLISSAHPLRLRMSRELVHSGSPK
jgi:hypothetical protein